MTKKKLLVVVGAGASIEAGMPSVEKIGDILGREAQKHFSFVNHPEQNLYEWLSTKIALHREVAAKPAKANQVNFEDVMYAISSVSSVYPAGIHTSSLGALVDLKPVPEVIWFDETRRPFAREIWDQFGVFLSDTIIDTFRERCKRVEHSISEKIATIKSFFAHLSEKFIISVITLNYDDIIYRCLNKLVTGFDGKGVFRDELLLCRSDWPCIIHLHGSVHFDMCDTKSDIHNIQWQEDLEETFNQNASGREYILSHEGNIYPNSVIIAGLGKTSQLIRRPFRTYYSEVDHLVCQSDALLCLGYGFRDTHLNIALSQYRNERNRPVVIIDYACDNILTASSGYSDAHPPIARAMRILKTNTNSMHALGYPMPVGVGELKNLRQFDLSSDLETPLAIWYNGMLEACRSPEKIISHL